MKRLLSILILCMLVLSGCSNGKQNVVTITASGETYVVESNNEVLSAGSGFIVVLEQGNAVAMLLRNEDCGKLKDSALSQDMIVEESEDYFIYDESADDSSMFTIVTRINDKTSYVISHSDLDLLKNVVSGLNVRRENNEQ